MPQPLERIGRPASPGIAVGPLAPFSSVVRPIAAATTDAAAARARLTQALAAAAQELARLLAAAEPDGQAILEFQIAMLEDGDLQRCSTRADRGRRIGGGGLERGARRGDRRLCRCRRRLFPRPGGRSRRSARPRAAAPRRRGGRGAAGRLDPDRRRPRTEPVPGDRLEPGWRRHPGARQPAQPCRHSGAGARHPDGRRPGQLSANGHADAIVDGETAASCCRRTCRRVAR